KQLNVARASKRPATELLDEVITNLKKRGKTKGYIKDVDARVRHLLRYAKARTPTDVNPSNVENWLNDFLDRGLSASSHNHALARAGEFFRWCVRKHDLQEDPTKGVARQNEDADMRRPARALSRDELNALIDKCPCPKRKLWYLLGGRAGLRWTEIGRLKWGNLDVEGGCIRLDAAITKSKRGDDLPMAKEIAEAAKAIVPENVKPRTPVFENQPARLTWLRDLARAGIIEIKGNLYSKWVDGKREQAEYELVGYQDDRGRVVSRQSLRKTFGTHLAMVEPNISVVAKLMRHSTPTLTLRLYEDARLMDLRGAVDRLDGSTSGQAVAV
ncbi:MAG: tyrosine-type recombinase/integrase, partial [Planctomycetota bacterium]